MNTKTTTYIRTSLAAAALALTGLAQAQGTEVGDLMGMDPVTMRTVVVAGTPSDVAIDSQAYVLQGDAVEPAVEMHREQLAAHASRDQVKEELALARQHGLLTRAGEAGDTRNVLQARAAYNADQTAALSAERDAAQAEAQARLSMADQAEGETLYVLMPVELVVIDME